MVEKTDPSQASPFSDGLRSIRAIRPSGVIARIRRLIPEGRALPEDVWLSRHRTIVGLLVAHAVGLFIFAVIRGKLDWDNDICNHRAKVVVRDRGRVIWSRTSSVRRGCQIFRVVRTFAAYRNFPSPSYACGSFYENGVLQARFEGLVAAGELEEAVRAELLS